MADTKLVETPVHVDADARKAMIKKLAIRGAVLLVGTGVIVYAVKKIRSSDSDVVAPILLEN